MRGARPAGACVVVPLVDVELARRAGQQRVVLRRASSNSIRTQPISPAGMRSALAPERLGDQLRAEADAEHRQPARVRVRDQLALALERRVAVGAVRVDDAAEHHQPVEVARRGLGLRERVPRDGAHAERGERRLERCQRRVEIVLDDEDGRVRAHGLIFAHRRGGGAELAKVRPMRASVLLAMGLLYIVWGSTYLAIRVSLETMPPLVSCGVRFVLAGLLVLDGADGARPRRPAAGMRRRSAAPRSPGSGSSSAASAS